MPRTRRATRSASFGRALRGLAVAAAALAGVGALPALHADPAVAVGAPLLCDQSTVYGIDSSHALKSINVTTGATSTIASLPNSTNALGVTTGGTHAYAFSSGTAATGGAVNTLDDYDASAGTVSQVTAVDGHAGAIRGAVDPANGLFYYATNTTSSTTYLGAYDPVHGTRLGQVGSIRVAAYGSGGDMAFSKAGDLYFLTGNMVYRVDDPVPTTSGTGELGTTLIATVTNVASSPGLAFAANGYLYAAVTSGIRRIDPTTGVVGPTITVTPSFSAADLAGCNNPDSLQSSVQVDDRVRSTDQWTVTLGGGTTWPAPSRTATTSGTATGMQSATAGPVLAVGGGTYTATETMASGSTADYDTTWSCSDSSGVLASDRGTVATVTPRTANGVNGEDIDCRFTNTAKTGSVSWRVALGSARASDDDQFVLGIHRDTAGGAVVGTTTTGGAGSTVTADTATGAVTATHAAALTAATAPGSRVPLSRYDGTVTCTGRNGAQTTGLPTAAPFTGSVSVAPARGADLQCVLTLSPKPAQLRASVDLGGARFDDNDQFTIGLQDGSGATIGSTGTTGGSGSAVASGTGTAGPATVASGSAITVVGGPTAHTSKYAETVTCTDADGFSTGLPDHVPFTGSLAVTPAADADLRCALSVGPKAASVSAAVALGGARLDDGDQFTIALQDGGGAAIGRAATTGGSGADLAPGSGTTGPATVPAGGAVVIVGAPVRSASRYAQSLTCTDANGSSTGLPDHEAFTGSRTVTAGADADLRCVLTVAPAPAHLSAAVGLGGARFDDGDQFTVRLQDGGGAAIGASATTAGRGADVTAGTGATGSSSVPAGGAVAVVAAATAHAEKYARVLTCTDAAGFTTGLPDHAPFDGSTTVRPAAGGAVTCTVDVELARPDLTVSLTPPASLAVGATARYRLAVDNGGGRAGTPTVAVRLPPGLTVQGVDGDGWSCTASGAPAVGQLLTCTGPSTPVGAERTAVLRLLPDARLAGLTPAVRATVDPVGGGAPADPTACSTGATCAIAPAPRIDPGVDLAITASGPETLVRNVPAQYLLTVTNHGTGPAAQATVSDRLPEGVRLIGATGADCTADGRLVTCTVPGPIAPGGSVPFTLQVVATSDVGGTNRVSVDPDGGATPAAPASCAAGSTCDSVASTVATPAITLAVAVQDGIAPRRVGDVVRYVYTVTNTGAGALERVRLSDGTVCPGVLAVGASVECVSGEHVVTQRDVDRGRFLHDATASADLVGCVSDCALASNPVRVAALTRSTASLRLTQTATLRDRDGDGRADAGERVRFRGVVTNTGTVRVTHLLVRGSLVALRCPVASLAPGASTVCVGLRVVRQHDIVGGVVTNTARATANGGALGDVRSADRTAALAAGAAPGLLASTGLDLWTPLGAAALLLLLALIGVIVLRRRAVRLRR